MVISECTDTERMKHSGEKVKKIIHIMHHIVILELSRRPVW